MTSPHPIDPPAPEPHPRPGGRTARVRAQVLEATLAELTEHGFEALTVDAVAERARVHRTTVYRRWHDVAGLITDVFESASGIEWQPSDTGTLLGDLASLNREIQDSLTEEPSLALALIAVSARSAGAADALRELWENRYAQSEIIVRRAVQREEIHGPVAARELLITATAPIYHEMVLLRTPPDPGLPQRAAATAVIAARAGAFTVP